MGCEAKEGDFEKRGTERRKILVIAEADHFTEEAMDYALNLAERLDYNIFAVNFGKGLSALSPMETEILWRESFRNRAEETAGTFKKKALYMGVHCEHVVKFGDVGTIVEELNQELKRVEFAVADATVNREEIAHDLTIPIFGVISNSSRMQEGAIMAKEQINQRPKPWKQTIGYGALSAALYAAVFANAGTVMQYFSKGGWYAALPIATVFVFSFAHGAFASHLWSLLGIEAVRKNALRQVERRVVQKRKRVEKRPRVYAYVNPFHRI
jgi:hypothetical protein